MKTFFRFTEECRERGLLEPIRRLCYAGGARLEDVFGRTRTQSVVRVRHAVFAHLVERGLSRSEVGILFDRDPSTVMHAIQRLREEQSQC